MACGPGDIPAGFGRRLRRIKTPFGVSERVASPTSWRLLLIILSLANFDSEAKLCSPISATNAAAATAGILFMGALERFMWLDNTASPMPDRVTAAAKHHLRSRLTQT